MEPSKALFAACLVCVFIVCAVSTLVTPSGGRSEVVLEVKSVKRKRDLVFPRGNPKLSGLNEPIDMIELEADIQDLAVDLIDLHDSSVVMLECSHGVK